MHKDVTDQIVLKDIVDEFIGNSEHRIKIFGKKRVTSSCKCYIIIIVL